MENRFKNWPPKKLLKYHKKHLDLKNNFCFCCKHFQRINEFDAFLRVEKCSGIYYNTAEYPSDYAAHCWEPRQGYDKLGQEGYVRYKDIQDGNVDI